MALVVEPVKVAAKAQAKEMAAKMVETAVLVRVTTEIMETTVKMERITEEITATTATTEQTKGNTMEIPAKTTATETTKQPSWQNTSS
ncbi:hypothetical protein P9761_15835 [Brevibacillus centrosporus]|uniref:hypothetical protein n=1 Tax=Brevibacillus centrosporus TaxID=54910 RepID=UPI002E1C6976|nr:hypothetical protein [Brevibacillus centrosporus]